MKSKTKISKQENRKNNPVLVETIRAAKKHKSWMEVASILASPKANRVNVNLNEVDRLSKEKEIVVVPGKVLGDGNVNKKMKIVALSFSESAKEKLKSSGSEAIILIDEIKKNPDAKGIKILK